MTAKHLLDIAKSYMDTEQGTPLHKRLLSIYNQKPLPRGYAVKETDNWCAMFISAVAIEAGCETLIPKECSASKMYEEFKKQDRAFGRNYKPSSGDIVFYSELPSDYITHVGIVESVADDRMKVIEGNYDNKVGCRSISLNDTYIVGYGAPNYNAKNTTNTEKILEHYNRHEKVVAEVRNGIWGRGVTRKNRLKKAGYNPTIVQALVNLLEL